MNSIQSTHTSAAQTGDGLPGSLVLLLAAGAGLSVASLYYAQPMLGVLGADIQAGARSIGLIPTFTQLGYALSILFLAPLGDRFDRRRIILIKAAALVLSLLASGFAPGLGALLAASLCIGLSARLAQDMVPAAATLASDAHRGKVVGKVMIGLLLGILLSRVISGFVAEHFGWRAVYLAASVAVTLIGVAAWRGLPRFQATTQLSYGALLGSMAALWRHHAELRRAVWAQGLLSAAFSAFWSTLAVMLHDSFHLGSAAGALAAPLAGRLADRRGPGLVTQLGAALTTLSFAMMALAPLVPQHMQLGLIVAGAIGFDFGIQAVLIAHQTLVYGIDPGARSRLNAVLFTGMFIGMAVGAALGSLLLAEWGWQGVVALTTAASGLALVVRLVGRRARTAALACSAN
ncbi:MAG: MFS transporter [Candidatus Protistobacter heckmanni]|nr:MFS transporter [Candidatus Protistobacter heckmanni]